MGGLQRMTAIRATTVDRHMRAADSNRCISVVASGTSTDHSGLCCVTVPIFAPAALRASLSSRGKPCGYPRRAALGAPENSEPAAPDRPGQRQCRLPRIVFF